MSELGGVFVEPIFNNAKVSENVTEYDETRTVDNMLVYHCK